MLSLKWIPLAQADFATLIATLKLQWSTQSSAVVAFGGSYGGMLAAWLRAKYPSAVDGAVAASAPVLAFAPSPGSVPPAVPFGDGEGYWQVVTADAGAAGGASVCARALQLHLPGQLQSVGMLGSSGV